MQISIQSPRKFLNPLLSKKSIVSSDFEIFKAALVKYAQDVQQQKESKQSEPNIVAGALMPFLQASPLSYKCRPHSHKGQSGIDLAILSGTDVAVIIEAKVVGSKDMITAHDLNRKAFHEAIFYFMQERERGNDKLTHIVITDFYEWFVFDAQDFDRLFWRNAHLKKTFHAYHNPNLLTKTTAEVYAAIEAEIPKMLKALITEVAIDCAYFNVAAPNSINDKELIAIYKLLGPDCLLKAFNPNDANSLNREFYNELLYILGLEEVKDGGKRLISSASTAGGFYAGIADKLDQQDKPHAFEDVIKLIIIWINRILFLKLLESQIVTWTGDKTSRFLSSNKISSYDELENLFFDTLARRVPDRKNKSFDYIPYLNSSLFEMQAEEKAGIGISALSDSTQMDYYAKTVVKNSAKNRKSGKINTLAYLFEFMDAYDFANDSGDEVVAETKSLISASVLGLIFEKINGYKDGSFFTPSFVTMHMARQSIEKAVLQKFNEEYGWACTALMGDGGLNNKIKDHEIKKKDSNALIDSLKICDPAVGSGHFLVSVLNEILYIKSMLGLLVDEAGNRLGYDINIENDELIVTSDEGELFEYKKGSKEKTRVQKNLFQEKQKIIENCLFGVDINPNSVNICRLRLWIELLKSAYYQPDGTLETLPNIDINIKCGNSLISRFALDTNLKDALKKSKISVNDYRTAVSNYRNTSDKAQKRQIEGLITEIKSKFRKDLQTNDPNLEKFKKAQGALRMLEGQVTLFEESAEKKKEKRKGIADLKADIAKYETAIEDIKSNKIYKDAFEWRLEFPEVLGEVGNFIGFDVVIGNPPYIDSESMVNKGLEAEREYIVDNYQTARGNWDIYIPFFEKSIMLSNARGVVSLITPDKWLTKPFGQLFREKYSPWMSSIAKAGRDIFESATVDSLITEFYKKHTGETVAYTIGEGNIFKVNNKINISKAENFSFDTLFSSNLLLINKLNALPNKINSFSECENACATSDAYKLKEFVLNDENAVFDSEKYFKIINTGTIDKYSNKYGMRHMTYLKDKYLKPVVLRDDFLQKFSNSYGQKSKVPKLIGKSLTLLDWCIDEKGQIIPAKSTLVIKSNNVDLLKLLLPILNSKLIIFYIRNVYASSSYNGGINFTKDMINNIPTPELGVVKRQIPISKVNAILEAKAKGADTVAMEREIDDMVYKLYGLTYDEVRTIEPEYSSMSQDEYASKVYL
jgi:hypothetical protein